MTPDRRSRRSIVRDLRVPRLALRALLLAAAGALTALAIAFAAGDMGGRSAASATVVRATGFSFANNKANSPILTISSMKPGTSQSGEVTISNDGTIDGQLSLAKAITGDTHPNGTSLLSDQLDLLIEDVTNAGSPVQKYSGKLGAMSDRDLGTLTAGTNRTYRFTVTLPASSPNDFQGAQTIVRYDWTATGQDTGTTTGTTSTATTPPTDTGTVANNSSFTPSGGGSPAPPNVTLGGSTTQYTTDGYSIVLVCSQACTVGLGGTANVPGASKVYRLPVKYVQLRAGVRTTVKVKLPRNVAAAVKKAVNRNRRVTVKVALNIRNAAGASRNSTHTIVIKKKR